MGLTRIVKSLFCNHVFIWQENLNYVQQSLTHFKYQSIWKCKFCGKEGELRKVELKQGGGVGDAEVKDFVEKYYLTMIHNLS